MSIGPGLPTGIPRTAFETDRMPIVIIELPQMKSSLAKSLYFNNGCTLFAISSATAQVPHQSISIGFGPGNICKEKAKPGGARFLRRLYAEAQKEEFMKRNIILVLDADADTARAVASAAADVNCDIRFVRTSKDFFHFCHEDFENVSAIILDVDPGVHGMAILEALDACENTPPIIVVSALEEHRLSSIVQQHGASPASENL